MKRLQCGKEIPDSVKFFGECGRTMEHGGRAAGDESDYNYGPRVSFAEAGAGKSRGKQPQNRGKQLQSLGKQLQSRGKRSQSREKQLQSRGKQPQSCGEPHKPGRKKPWPAYGRIAAVVLIAAADFLMLSGCGISGETEADFSLLSVFGISEEAVADFFAQFGIDIFEEEQSAAADGSDAEEASVDDDEGDAEEAVADGEEDAEEAAGDDDADAGRIAGDDDGDTGEADAVYERDAELISSEAGSLTLLDLSEMGLTATDSDEALEVLDGLSGILNIDDAQEELTLKNENSFSGSSYYRYQQVYEGLTVYGRSIVLAADEDGSVDLLSGNLADMTGAVTEPVIDTAAAIEAAQAYLEEAESEEEAAAQAYLEEADDGDEASADAPDSSEEAAAEYDAELCYYMAEGTDTPSLSWAVEIGFDTVFVDAVCGIVLGEVSSLTEVTDVLNGQTGAVQVDVTYEGDDIYSMTDEERNITCYVNLEPDAAFEDDDFYGPSSKVELITYIDDPVQPSAVDALHNVEIVYDFYRELFDHISTDGNGDVEIRIFDSIYWLRTSDGEAKKKYNNAFSMGNGSTVSVIAICPTSFDTTFADDLDVIAHEYTHQVLNLTSGLISNEGESGALHEGIADIMGEMAEGWSTGSCDWIMGADIGNGLSIRNLISPSGDSLASYADYTSDTEVHDGSTIVSHAAYLMWAGDSTVDGIEPINSVETMSELWYRTILLLNSDATFSDCRTACEAAAGQMQKLGLLSEEQTAAVIWAFDQVGVYSGAAAAYYDGLKVTIYDAVGSPTDQYVLTVLDDNGTLISTHSGASVGSSVDLTLDPGIYRLVVTSAEGDYTSEEQVICVAASDVRELSTWIVQTELEIHTTFGTSLSGQVTDAQGNPLEGVQITVEPAQIGQTQAEQIAQEISEGGSVYSSGQVLALAQQTSALATITTDASGGYSAKLPVGIYQLTLELDGYTTSTVRQVVLSGDNTAETVVLEADNNASELELYAEILDMFYYGISTQWAAWKEADAYYSSSDYPLSYRWYWFDIAETLSDAGFALMDLDGNGVAELLVNTAADDGSTIIDLYTWRDGKVIHLAGDSERCEYWLCMDYTIGYHDSASGYSGSYEFWRVDDASDQLLLTESLFYQYADHDYVQDEQDAAWYYSTAGYYGYSGADRIEPEDEDVISADEALEVLGRYERLNYELTLFSEYTPVSDGSEYMSLSNEADWAAVYLELLEEVVVTDGDGLHDELYKYENHSWYTGFSLIYVDDDDIPELVMHGAGEASCNLYLPCCRVSGTYPEE